MFSYGFHQHLFKTFTHICLLLFLLFKGILLWFNLRLNSILDHTCINIEFFDRCKGFLFPMSLKRRAVMVKSSNCHRQWGYGDRRRKDLQCSMYEMSVLHTLLIFFTCHCFSLFSVSIEWNILPLIRCDVHTEMGLSKGKHINITPGKANIKCTS